MTRLQLCNPMLDEIESDRDLNNAMLRDYWPSDSAETIRTGKKKNSIRCRYGYGIPGAGAIITMQRHVDRWSLDGVVEIGAGTGYWAWMLFQAGVPVDAYDDRSWGFQNLTPDFYPVMRGGPNVTERYPCSALLLVWPPMSSQKRKLYAIARRRNERDKTSPPPKYEDDRDYWGRRMKSIRDGERALARGINMAGAAIRAFTGDVVFYVGESDGGCTGCEAFHAEIALRWTKIDDCPVPTWSGLHDRLRVYARNGSEAAMASAD